MALQVSDRTRECLEPLEFAGYAGYFKSLTECENVPTCWQVLAGWREEEVDVKDDLNSFIGYWL